MENNKRTKGFLARTFGYPMGFVTWGVLGVLVASVIGYVNEGAWGVGIWYGVIGFIVGNVIGYFVNRWMKYDL